VLLHGLFGGLALFKRWVPFLLVVCTFLVAASPGGAQDSAYPAKKLVEQMDDPKIKGDSAWMMVATAFVMLMVPGLALFYGGMVRRKNVLSTMMQSMVALAVVGVYWVAIGYALAFGQPLLSTSQGSFIGFRRELVFLAGVQPYEVLAGTNIPVFLHMLYQGMFAIITPALISGAVAERIRFKPYCIFLILWVTFVYCPLAHCVWAQDWWTGAADAGTNAVGYLGKMGALDFAGGTVVHIAAGFSGLAAILVLRQRIGYPEHAMHPNSMVLTLTGAGILWFGWFGFNGGSGLTSGAVATSAFAATLAAAAAAA
jgi:Amt family ammonium transporter